MYRSIFLSLAAMIFFSAGCANEPAVPVTEVAVIAPIDEQRQEADEDAGLRNKFADLVEQAKGKTPSLDDVKKLLNDAGDATGQSADDSMKWANEMYKSLSDRGMTTAQNAGDWVSEDWNSMNAWEYKVVNVDGKEIAKNPALLEETLNENGKNRWDCFHVTDANGSTRCYMKRQKRSYLKNMPLKDMLKLIPLLDGNNE